MSKKRIGIVGGEEEAHCVHMKRVLEGRGAEVVVLDTNRFPARQDMTFRDDATLLGQDGLTDLHAVYVRTIFYSLPFFEADPSLGQQQARRHVGAEARVMRRVPSCSVRPSAPSARSCEPA